MTMAAHVPPVRIPAWEDSALCRRATPEQIEADFFPLMETELRAQRTYDRWCGECPVIHECLTRALLCHSEGIYAGTTTGTRTKLLKRRSRARCPVPGCHAAVDIEITDPRDGEIMLSEVCRCCGASWKADGPPGSKPVALRLSTSPAVEP
jgi:hypothetical protein